MLQAHLWQRTKCIKQYENGLLRHIELLCTKCLNQGLRWWGKREWLGILQRIQLSNPGNRISCRTRNISNALFKDIYYRISILLFSLYNLGVPFMALEHLHDLRAPLKILEFHSLIRFIDVWIQMLNRRDTCSELGVLHIHENCFFVLLKTVMWQIPTLR